jgi:phospholipid/cholesterol/gamma-HCH transport system permease protein
MLKLLTHVGRYMLWMSKVFRRPEKMRMYRIRIFEEIMAVGYNSVGLVALVSLFMGAVLTLQLAYNLESPLIPLYTVGLGVRDSIIWSLPPPSSASFLPERWVRASLGRSAPCA